jgi:hypothetical protein
MNKTTNKTKSNLKNRINRLIPLNRLFVSSKKEKNNSNSVSENLSITDNNKNVSTFKQFTSKANTYQHENNKNKNDNEYKNHANIQKPSNGSNNIKNNGESLQDFRELVQIEYIYKKNNILLDGLNTIFIAETYLKTLPDYLPNELKRRTVLDIINHNGISTDKGEFDAKYVINCAGVYADAINNMIAEPNFKIRPGSVKKVMKTTS